MPEGRAQGRGTGPVGRFDPQRTYDSAAGDYDDASRDFWGHVALRSIERLRLLPGERVLDVPCGPGAGLMAAADAVGPGGEVVGIDYAPQMVARAGQRARAAGYGTVTVRQGDMLAIEPPSVPFDAAVCALGVFFADDMAGFVQSLVRLVRPGSGRLALGVFGEVFFEPMRTVFLEVVHDVAPELTVVEPWRRSEDEATLLGLFAHADVADLRIDTDADHLPLPSPAHWWRIVMGSALRSTVAQLDPAAAEEVRSRCEAHIRDAAITALATTTRYAVARRSPRRDLI